MNLGLFERLTARGLITPHSLEKIRNEEKDRQYGVFRELNVLLYLGVLLFTTGLGLFVYAHFDRIGPATLLILNGLLALITYLVCFLKVKPFTAGRQLSGGIFTDYLLVISAAAFVLFLGFWQYQFGVFGSQGWLAPGLSTAFLFFTAYRFDHLGVLCMAIASLAAWLGISINPHSFIFRNDFSRISSILVGLSLGAFLLLAARFSIRVRLKAHFAFTYTNFAMHFLYVFGVAALWNHAHLFYLWLPLLALITWYFYQEALTIKSFYLLLTSALYAYVGFSGFLLDRSFWDFLGVSSIFLICIYFIGSASGLVLLLIRLNKKFKSI